MFLSKLMLREPVVQLWPLIDIIYIPLATQSNKWQGSLKSFLFGIYSSMLPISDYLIQKDGLVFDIFITNVIKN